MVGRRGRRDRRSVQQHVAQHAVAGEAAGQQKYSRRGRRLPGEQAIPSYTPSIGARSIDGHLLRTSQDVYAWYRLAPQRWSFRSDSQRQDLIAAIAGQYAELQGRWMHLRVTTRPYPIRMWAEAHVHNAVNRLPDTPGTLSFDDFMVGEQQQLMGRSMAEKEVYLGVQVQTRTVVDRAVERVAPLLRKVFPDAVDAELVALDSEVEHLDQVILSMCIRDSRGDVLADAPVLLAGPARAAQPARRARRGLGTRGPGQLHRRRRLPPGPLLAHGHRARPHRLQRRHQAARRRAHRRPDARVADPRGRRPVGAALGPAARLGGVVRAHLRAPARGGLRRTAAADEQGPLAGPPLHRRARAGTAAVADQAGRPGARHRRRDDLGLHLAGHPGALVVAAGRVRPHRAGRAAAGPAAARPVQAEDRHRAPRGAVRHGQGVHPG